MQHPIQAYSLHRLGSGRMVTAGGIVKAIRTVKGQPASAVYPEGLTGGYLDTGADILRQFDGYVNDAVNRRGGLTIPDTDTPARQTRQFRRLCERARPSVCKWCGFDLGRFIPLEGSRFCEASCARSYRGY